MLFAWLVERRWAAAGRDGALHRRSLYFTRQHSFYYYYVVFNQFTARRNTKHAYKPFYIRIRTHISCAFFFVFPASSVLLLLPPTAYLRRVQSSSFLHQHCFAAPRAATPLLAVWNKYLSGFVVQPARANAASPSACPTRQAASA